MRTVSAAELKAERSEILGRVLFRHEHLVISRPGKPVAKLSPLGNAPIHLADLKGWLIGFFEPTKNVQNEDPRSVFAPVVSLANAKIVQRSISIAPEWRGGLGLSALTRIRRKL